MLDPNFDNNVWRNAEGVQISDAFVIEALKDYRPTNELNHFYYGNKTIPVEAVLGWKREFDLYTSKFMTWCLRNATVCDLEELNAYFGDVATMLDFKRQQLLWTPYFESKCSCYGTEDDDLIKKFSDQLEFEEAAGLNQIGNASLFPSRYELLEAIGGFDYPIKERVIRSGLRRPRSASRIDARHAAIRVDGKHVGRVSPNVDSQPKKADDIFLSEALRLSGEWEQEDEPKAILKALYEKATESYIRDDYNPSEIFNWFIDEVEGWVRNKVGTTRQYKLNEDLLRRVSRRLAALKLIGNQRDFSDHIARVSSSPVRTPEKLTDDKIAKLKRGTAWKPN